MAEPARGLIGLHGLDLSDPVNRAVAAFGLPLLSRFDLSDPHTAAIVRLAAESYGVSVKQVVDRLQELVAEGEEGRRLSPPELRVVGLDDD